VVVHIPGFLRQYTGERALVEVSAPAETVGDALSALCALHPGVRDRVLTERGALRPHVNLFVGMENVRDLDGLRTPVRADSEISIVPAVSGGSPGLTHL
jgi:molybdopterin converting factor small subunit